MQFNYKFSIILFLPFNILLEIFVILKWQTVFELKMSTEYLKPRNNSSCWIGM